MQVLQFRNRLGIFPSIFVTKRFRKSACVYFQNCSETVGLVFGILHMFCTIATFNLTAVNFFLFHRVGLLSPSAVMLKVTINYYIFLVIPMRTSPKIVNFSCPRLLLKYIIFWYICHFKPNCSKFPCFSSSGWAPKSCCSWL